MSIKAGEDGDAADFDFIVGAVLPYAGRVAPTGWFACDGSAISRSTYSDLFDVICASVGTFTVTIASPGVFTLSSHGFVVGDAVYFTTTGTLPTGLSVDTIYYIIAAGLTSSAFEVSTTRGGAAVNTSGSQSGTHTARHCPYGLGDGSTTFNLPDLQQSVPVGYKSADSKAGYIGQAGGEHEHTLTEAELAAHTHTGNYRPDNEQTGFSGIIATSLTDAALPETGSAGSDTAHENMPPYVTMFYIIRGAY